MEEGKTYHKKFTTNIFREVTEDTTRWQDISRWNALENKGLAKS